MQIRFHCPTDRCVAIIEYQPLESCAETIQCPRCQVKHAISVTASMRDEQIVDCCAVCGCRELFVRKDFPQLFGGAVVVVFGVAALYAFTISVAIAWSILTAAVLLDAIIYLLVAKLTSCYACRAEYRLCSIDPALEGFDLARSEKY